MMAPWKIQTLIIWPWLVLARKHKRPKIDIGDLNIREY